MSITSSFQMEKCLRGQRRFIILETRNEGVRFTLPPLRSLSEEYSQLREQYNDNQQKFTEEVLQIAGMDGWMNEWIDSFTLCSWLF